jgi:hypothetical protein
MVLPPVKLTPRVVGDSTKNQERHSIIEHCLVSRKLMKSNPPVAFTVTFQPLIEMQVRAAMLIVVGRSGTQ